MDKRQLGLGSVLVGVLLMASCSSAPAGPTTAIAVSTREFAFSPGAWTVRAAQEIPVTVTNAGAVDHEWVIIKDQKQLANEGEFQEDLVYFEVEAVPAGQTANGTFTAPAAGTYQVICALDGHLDAGMKATLTVVP